MEPISADAGRIADFFVGRPSLLRHPLALASSGMWSLRDARTLAESVFEGEWARGLFAGNAAHSFLRLDQPPSAMFGLLLGTLGHAFGWPFPKGGSQALADALASYLASLGGEIYTDAVVRSVEDVPRTRAVLFDVTPRQLLDIAGEHFTEGYNSALKRYRYGPGIFKVDFALDGPIPWAAEGCERAGTVHLGGTLDEVAAGEGAVSRGEHPERPFILLAQQSLFDRTRAPEGKHTVWAYCHVPNGSTFDMTGRIEAQIERFAPGFQGPCSGQERRWNGRPRTVEPQPRRRRHQRRVHGSQAALHQAHAQDQPLLDPCRRTLHLLLIDAAGWGRARHVRLPGCPRGLALPPVTGR